MGRAGYPPSLDDDVLDALVVALVTRAMTLGLTRPPAAGEQEERATEGWIYVPSEPLGALINEWPALPRCR